MLPSHAVLTHFAAFGFVVHQTRFGATHQRNQREELRRQSFVRTGARRAAQIETRTGEGELEA